MIRIVTDSASDITQEEARELGIDVLPLTTFFGTTEYKDGITISHHEFFELLEKSMENPTTSCFSPGQMAEIYDKYPDDNIIYIAVSSTLSGCYQSGVIAKGERENIYVLDSKSVSPGQRLLVELALDMVNKGLDVKEIYEELERKVEKLYLIAVVDTLEYLKRGGRIPATVAMIGGMLSIKPVIELKNGVISILGKTRGVKNAQSFLNETIAKNGGIDFSLPYNLAYSGNDDHLIVKYASENAHLYTYDPETVKFYNIGSTIGTHVGPGAFAVTFFTK